MNTGLREVNTTWHGELRATHNTYSGPTLLGLQPRFGDKLLEI